MDSERHGMSCCNFTGRVCLADLAIWICIVVWPRRLQFDSYHIGFCGDDLEAQRDLFVLYLYKLVHSSQGIASCYHLFM